MERMLEEEGVDLVRFLDDPTQGNARRQRWAHLVHDIMTALRNGIIPALDDLKDEKIAAMYAFFPGKDGKLDERRILTILNDAGMLHAFLESTRPRIVMPMEKAKPGTWQRLKRAAMSESARLAESAKKMSARDLVLLARNPDTPLERRRKIVIATVPSLSDDGLKYLLYADGIDEALMQIARAERDRRAQAAAPSTRRWSFRRPASGTLDDKQPGDKEPGDKDSAVGDSKIAGDNEKTPRNKPAARPGFHAMRAAKAKAERRSASTAFVPPTLEDDESDAALPESSRPGRMHFEASRKRSAPPRKPPRYSVGAIRILLKMKLVTRRERLAATAMDGNCFYHALNVGFGGETSIEAAKGTRSLALEWMVDEANLATVADYAHANGVELDDLMETIATTGNWSGDAGDLVPRVLASALGVNIRIQQAGLKMVLIPPLSGPAARTVTVSLSGQHYSAVRRVGRIGGT
jgi:hypothetical protein